MSQTPQITPVVNAFSERRVKIAAAEFCGYWRCDCNDGGMSGPHCGWWFKDHKAYIEEDLPDYRPFVAVMEGRK